MHKFLPVTISWLLLTAPTVSWASGVDLFIKMECKPKANFVSIHIFGEESGTNEMTFRKSSDIYPVEDDKVRVCRFSDKQEVLVGPSYTVPVGNSQYIEIRVKLGVGRLPIYYHLDFSDWKVEIKRTSSGSYTGRYCATTDTNFVDEIKKRFAGQFRKHEVVCELDDEDERTTYTVQDATTKKN